MHQPHIYPRCAFGGAVLCYLTRTMDPTARRPIALRHVRLYVSGVNR